MAQPSATPSWLTAEFLEKHLQKHYKNTKIRVTDHMVKPPSNDTNFASKIYRVLVEFESIASNDEVQSENGVSVHTKNFGFM